ncbi:hypothetical protein QUB68_29730 [Microcoleus sp. A006_D1]|uniref:hypothetical protein n=1 Tax=Microcoleus sp. A006_D1 TaxID=3055267 RepID=UPI002FD1F592
MQQLEASDAIIRNRNQEIATLNARLAGKDEIIAEADAEIENLKSELSNAKLAVQQYSEIAFENLREKEKLESELVSEKNKSSAATGKDLSEIEAADLLNKLKSQRKKSKADLADIEAVLEILDK